MIITFPLFKNNRIGGSPSPGRRIPAPPRRPRGPRPEQPLENRSPSDTEAKEGERTNQPGRGRGAELFAYLHAGRGREPPPPQRPPAASRTPTRALALARRGVA